MDKDTIISVKDLHVKFTLRGAVLNVIRGISLDIHQGESIAIVGESGSGKSTISSILMKRNRKYTGHVLINDTDLNQISESSLMENITYVSHQSYLFKGTIKDNLLIAKPDASDEELWNVLNKAKLSIMQLIHELANEKTVILVSHRLANVKDADMIYVLEKGNIAEVGKHEKLLQNQSVYASLWNAQVSLESYIGGGNA